MQPDHDDLNAPLIKKVVRDWAMMNSSKRHLLQAEVEYWHEMLHLNRQRLSEQTQSEMRYFLKRALCELNQVDEENTLAAA